MLTNRDPLPRGYSAIPSLSFRRDVLFLRNNGALTANALDTIARRGLNNEQHNYLEVSNAILHFYATCFDSTTCQKEKSWCDVDGNTFAFCVPNKSQKMVPSHCQRAGKVSLQSWTKMDLLIYTAAANLAWICKAQNALHTRNLGCSKENYTKRKQHSTKCIYAAMHCIMCALHCKRDAIHIRFSHS